MILHFIILYLSAYAASSYALPLNTSGELLKEKELYPPKPTEMFPIEPILIYPSAKDTPYQGRALLKDNEIVYIKLLKRKSYRPKNVKSQVDGKYYPKGAHMKNIFYVKSLANGQFSPSRLKLYRLPEFYAITVYKMEPFNE